MSFRHSLVTIICLTTFLLGFWAVGSQAEVQNFPKLQAEQNNIPGGSVRTMLLSSGVKAFIQRVPKSEAMGVSLSVKAGSKLDTKGSWGRAHFLEHLLFRRTGSFSGGKLTVSLENVGADRGANTTENNINFWEVAPPSALDLTLQIESDRLSGLVFTQNELEMERRLLIDELKKLRTNPWRSVQQHLLSSLYPHLNEGELIPDGAIEDIQNITAKELVDFYKHNFIPNQANVYLITSEPFNLAAARLERHFGQTLLKKRKAWEVQSEAVYQKQQDRRRSETDNIKVASSKDLLSFAKVKACVDESGQGLAVLAWPAPKFSSDDYAHWLVLNILWADSSEAYLQRILQNRGLASQVKINYDMNFGDSLYVVGAHCTSEIDPQEVADLLERAVAVPVDNEFIVKRLEAAKGRAAAHFYQLWQNYRERLSLYNALNTDAENSVFVSIPEAIEQVKVEDINSLWRRLSLKQPKIFVSGRANFWRSLEASPGPRVVFASEVEKTVTKAKSNNSISTNSKAERLQLDNGMKLQVWTDESLPIVVMRGFLAYPQSNQPEIYQAAAGLLGHHLVKENEETKSFAEVLEREGAAISFSLQDGGAVINGWCLRQQLPRFLELLNSAFDSPQFEQVELDKALAKYNQSRDDVKFSDWHRALKFFTTKINSIKLEESKLINREELSNEELLHNLRSLVAPNRLSLNFSGRVSVDELKKACTFGIFSQTLDTDASKTKYNLTKASKSAQIGKFYIEGRQSDTLILAGQPGPSPEHPDYFAYKVILQMLGGSSSSRLPLRIVHLERLGNTAVTYDLLSGLGYETWLATLQVKNGDQDRAISILRQELQRLTSITSQEELKRAVSACKGKLQVAWSNPAGKAEWLRVHEGRAEAVLAPEIYLANYDKVSLHDVRRVAKTWFNSNNLTIICCQKKSSAQ